MNPGAKAELMIRASLTENAEHPFMLVWAGQGLAFQRRAKANHESAQIGGAAVAARPGCAKAGCLTAVCRRAVRPTPRRSASQVVELLDEDTDHAMAWSS